MTRLTRFWVVTAPRKGSGIADILFETTLEGFTLQVRVGLDATHAALFENEFEARAEAERRLEAYAAYRRVLDGKEGESR